MKLPICNFDAKNSILCPQCESKIESGKLTKADAEASIKLAGLAKTNQAIDEFTLYSCKEIDGNYVLTLNKNDIMKKVNIIYWIFTVLFGGVMIMTGIQHAMATPDVVKMISTDMGYPAYIVPFLGWVKILGGIAIFIPGFPRVTEWAYAGLFFDLIGAFYSLNANKFEPGSTFILLVMAVGALSYYLWRKKINALV